MDVSAILAFAATSLVMALAAIWISQWVSQRVSPKEARGALTSFVDTPRRYEFREGYLLSSLDPNDAFLPAGTDRTAALDVLRVALSDVAHDVPEMLSGLFDRGEAFVLRGKIGEDELSLSGRRDGDRTILTVAPSDGATGRHIVDAASIDAVQEEMHDLRSALDQSGAVIWREAADGHVVWANGAYFDLVEQTGATPDGHWPVPRIFNGQLTPRPDVGAFRRCYLSTPAGFGEDRLPFEVSAMPQTDGSVLWVAQPIARLLQAETSQQNLLQTLSETFAHLQTGLAVFDKTRSLVLFNPALSDLTTLSGAFLSSKPTLVAVLDALREARRIPEPRSDRDWRDQMVQIEQGARDGTYQALWTLPTGQSLNVIGRPHGDAGIAYLFEDVSSDLSLTRKFREDIDLHQAVLDDTPGALAVFRNDGAPLISNAGYRALWGAAARDHSSLLDATKTWQAQSLPTGLWGDIRQFAAQSAERSTWSEDIALRDGRRMTCRISPLAGGATAVRFMSPDILSSDELVARFERPPRPAARPVLYSAAEAPAPFRSQRNED